MIFLSVSASSSATPGGVCDGSVGDGDGGGGGIRLGSKVTSGDDGGVSGMRVSIFGGVLRVGDGVFGGGGAIGGDERGRDEKNSGGGIPGGIAGRLMTESGGGKGGANLGLSGRGTGAIANRELAGRGGTVWGRRPISVGVNSINPTEPGPFFDEFPP
jgi:hypothetical protein